MLFLPFPICVGSSGVHRNVSDTLHPSSRLADRQAGRLSSRQADRQAVNQAVRESGTQTGRQQKPPHQDLGSFQTPGPVFGGRDSPEY